MLRRGLVAAALAAALPLTADELPPTPAMSTYEVKTRSIFDRYHIVADSDLREAVERLGALHMSRRAQEVRRLDGANQ